VKKKLRWKDKIVRSLLKPEVLAVELAILVVLFTAMIGVASLLIKGY